MELNQLEVLVTVAREGSVSRAATRLHRTHPAVSMAMKRLEESLGEPLLVILNACRRKGAARG